MHILIIRHAEATGNCEGRMQGRGAFPLTEQGHTQAQALGNHLAQETWPSVIYSSPLRRAQQTTEILLSVLQLHSKGISQGQIPRVKYCEALQEFHHGILEGLTWPEAQQHYPDLCHQLEASQAWVPIPGAETLAAGRDRAEEFLQQVLATHTNAETLWIVSHQWLMQHLISALLGSTRTWQIPIGFTGVFEFEIDCDRWDASSPDCFNSTLWKIRRFNDVTHYP